MLEARNEHPLAQLFLEVYAELILRGTWTPNPDDPCLPAGVWINFNELEGCARHGRLRMPPAVSLLRVIRHRPGRPILFPCALRWRSVPWRPMAREYYVELHNPRNPWGAYAPTAEYQLRRREIERAYIVAAMAQASERTGLVFDDPVAYVTDELARWQNGELDRAAEEFGSTPPWPTPGRARDDLVIACRDD